MLSDADTRIYNTDADDLYFGTDIIDVGDLDGDGQDDLAVGWAVLEDGTGSTSGSIVLFLGPVSGNLQADSHDAVIVGSGRSSVVGAYRGSTANAGDVDGDGAPELIIGDSLATVDGNTYAGVAWLVSSADALRSTSVLLGSASFEGTASQDNMGFGVGNPGDVDGDGSADVMVGSHAYDRFAPEGGAVCLYYGPVSGTYTCADADAMWAGAAGYEYAGHAIEAGKDLTGDGWADIAIGARNADGVDVASGAVYIVPGLAP